MVQVGSSCMQGYRIHMEDSHTHILSLPDDPGTSFFAVYDGHGGANIGKYAAKHLHKFIVKRPEYPTDTPEALKKVSHVSLETHIVYVSIFVYVILIWRHAKLTPADVWFIFFVFFLIFAAFRHFWILTKHCWTKKNWKMRWAVRRLFVVWSKIRSCTVWMRAIQGQSHASMEKWVCHRPTHLVFSCI